MFKLLFKNLLLANYSFSKRWVNKKMPQNIIPTTLHIFTTPFTFLLAGVYLTILGSIKFRFDSFPSIFIGLAIIMSVSHFFIHKNAGKALRNWKIVRTHKQLSKNQKTKKNTLAFVFFWFGFASFFYLGVKNFEGYLLK